MDLTAPLLLHPITVPKPWGGHRLAELGRHDDHDTLIGESWDVADLPADATPVSDPVSRVVGGLHDGRSLAELLDAAPDALLGAAARSPEGRFPLLVKLLDARETLSVQVHPPASLDPDHFKTESWVVLDAEPGAELLLGLRDGVTRTEVADAIGTKAFLDLCAVVPAIPGEVIHLPAGAVHALGAGVLVAEVQTPSDVTHRLWDWPELRDGGRELRVEAGLDSIEAGWEHNFGLRPKAAADGVVVDTEAYALRHCTVRADEALTDGPDDRVRVVIVLGGAITWPDGDETVVQRRSGSIVLPAASTTVLRGGGDGAKVVVASPS